MKCQLSPPCFSAVPKEWWHVGNPFCSDLSALAPICCSDQLCWVPLSTLQPHSRLLSLSEALNIDSVSSLNFPKHNKYQFTEFTFLLWLGTVRSELLCKRREQNWKFKIIYSKHSISYSFQKDSHLSFKPLLCSRILIMHWFHRNYRTNQGNVCKILPLAGARPNGNEMGCVFKRHMS